MGLGTDFMRFCRRENLPEDGDGRIAGGRSIEEFLDGHPQYDHPSLVLRAARRLEDQTGLLQIGSDGFPIHHWTWGLIRSDLLDDQNLNYGTYDFIVDGFIAVLEHFVDSVLQLEVHGPDGTDAGSAFVVGDDHLLVTAAHCVSEKQRTTVIGPGGVSYDVPVDDWHEQDGDVAAVVLPHGLRVPPFRIVREPAILDEVVTIGYPKLPMFDPAQLATRGEIAGRSRTYSDEHSYLLTTCAMTGGSSGGPVVRSDGLVVGVVSALPGTDRGVDGGRFGVVSPLGPHERFLFDLASRSKKLSD